MLNSLYSILVFVVSAVQQVQDVAVSRNVSVVVDRASSDRAAVTRAVVVGVNSAQASGSATSRAVVTAVSSSQAAASATSRAVAVGVFLASNLQTATSRSVNAVSGPIPPDLATVKLGRREAGDVASLAFQDANIYRVCRFFVPNNSVPPINIEVEATSPDATVSSYGIRSVGRMTASGAFQQTLELWDWSANRWDPVDFSRANLSVSFGTQVVASSGNANRYLRSGDSRMRARCTIRSVGPASSASWCSEHDQVVFLTQP